MPLDASILARFQPPPPIDVLGPYKEAMGLQTAQLQQQDIASQIQQRQAIAQKDALATQKQQRMTQILSSAANDPNNFDENGFLKPDSQYARQLATEYPEVHGAMMEHAAKARSEAATAANQRGDLAVKQDTLKATQEKNLFEQQKEQRAETEKQAQEAAGTLIPGTEFTTPDASGKPARAAQFKVRQPDGTYQNVTRTLGAEAAAPQNAPQPTPPLSPERFAQEQTLAKQKEDAAAAAAAEKARLMGGTDERLVGVPTALHAKVYADVQKAEDAHTAARAATDTINTFLGLARQGNKEAYAYSPVAGVLEINTGAGVKRINRQEIESYGGAGSLFDRVAGGVGKAVSGASISASVLNDMQQLHNELSKNTDNTYQRSLQSIDRTYRSHFSGAGPAGGGKADPLGIR